MVIVVFASMAGVACAPPQPAAEPLKGVSTRDAFEGAQCSAARPQTEPDLMGWDPASRANLSRLSKSGIVAVRYAAKGCNVELKVISNCIGTGATYEFSAYSANERKLARNDAELFAALPIGAARLSGKLRGNRALRTDYMLAGTVAVKPSTSASDIKLAGPGCSEATHLVSAIYLGGFAMAAGEAREMEGAATLFGAGGGARSAAAVENLADEGDAQACHAAQRDGRREERCAVPLRVGLLPLGADERAPVVGSAPPLEPTSAPTTAASPNSGGQEDAARGHTAAPWLVAAGGLVLASASAGFSVYAANGTSCAAEKASKAAAGSTVTNFSCEDGGAGLVPLGVAGMIVGGLAVAGGLTWHFLEPTGATRQARVAPWIGPLAGQHHGGLLMGGAF